MGRCMSFSKYWASVFKRVFSGTFWVAEKWSGALALLYGAVVWVLHLTGTWETAVTWVPFAVFAAVFVGTVVVGLIVVPWQIHNDQADKIKDVESKLCRVSAAFTDPATTRERDARLNLWEQVSAMRATVRRRGKGVWDRWLPLENEYFSARSNALTTLEIFRFSERFYRLGHEAINSCDIVLDAKRHKESEIEAESEMDRASDTLRIAIEAANHPPAGLSDTLPPPSTEPGTLR